MNWNLMYYFDTYIKPWCHICNNSSLCYNKLISKLPFLAVANLKNQKPNWKFELIHWQVLNIWTLAYPIKIYLQYPLLQKTPFKLHSYCPNKISTEFWHKTNKTLVQQILALIPLKSVLEQVITFNQFWSWFKYHSCAMCVKWFVYQ